MKMGAVLELPANSTANPAHLPQNRAKLAKLAVLFSIAMGVEYLSYLKSIATFAPTFYRYIYYFRLSQCGVLDTEKATFSSSKLQNTNCEMEKRNATTILSRENCNLILYL